MPYEKYIYLNNRGTSYYYRKEYREAMGYFQEVIRLAGEYPDMLFEQNLARLNLSDCYLQLEKTDSALWCMQACRPFFEKMGVTTALYYLDTQAIELALLKKDFAQAREILSQSLTPPDIDPEMLHIRNNYLRQYFKETGDYRRAYRYLNESRRLDDSIRNERISMRTADLALRYQQDSTLLAHRIQIREAENEVLLLRQTQLIVWIVALIILLLAGFTYLYSKKKRALLQAESRRQISSLRLENIRGRLSPHFIFNVLNQEISSPGRKSAESELPLLVKLMRRNLELASEAELPEDATAPVTPEVVFRHFRTDHRQRIRRAEREGLRVRQLAADELDVLKEIAAEAGERHGFHDPDLKYYQEMAQAFGDKVEFWVVESPQEEEVPQEEAPQEEEALKWTPVCAAMFVLTNHEIVYLYSGSKRAYQKLGGAHLLQWQMVQRAITGDYQRYNFYGVRPEEGNGVFAFKQGFKGYVVEQLGTLILPLTPLGAVFAWRQKPHEFGSIH